MASNRRKAPKYQTAFQQKVAASQATKNGSSCDLSHASAGPRVPEDIEYDAETYLFKSTGAPRLIDINKENQIDWLKKQIIKYNKQNRRQHYETIAQSYAVYAASVNNPTLKMTITEASSLLGIKTNSRKSILRIIVELHVSYGDGESKTSIRQAEKNYSRDVNAISNLIKRKIPPSKVMETSEIKGEGLDKWARWSAPDDEIAPAKPQVRTPPSPVPVPVPVPVKPASNEEPTKRDDEVQQEEQNVKESFSEQIERIMKPFPNQIVWHRIRRGIEFPQRIIDVPSVMSDRLTELLDQLEEEVALLNEKIKK